MSGRGSSLTLAGAAMVALSIPAGSCSRYTPPVDSGGITLGPGACGAVTVVSTTEDYASTSVAALGFDGRVRSATMLSSASAATGLSQALSGDTVVPTSPTVAPHLVLIDRYPAAVLTWVDLSKGRVEGQLSVQTGFASNPYDYYEVSASKAYVSRYENNPSPGREPFDGGGDLLVIDPTAHRITGRVDLSAAFTDEAGIEPRPSRIVGAEGKIYVLCAALSKSFKANGDSKIVTIDTGTDAIVGVTTLTGSHGCLGLSISPDTTKLAVTCSGDFAGSNDPSIAQSALVVLDRASGPSVIARTPASTFGENPLGFSVAFASDTTVMFPTFGATTSMPPRKDALVRSSLDGSDHATLLESDRQAVVLGEVRCQEACGACFVADAERGVMQRFEVGPSGIGAASPIAIPNDGLLPRYVGAVGAPR